MLEADGRREVLVPRAIAGSSPIAWQNGFNEGEVRRPRHHCEEHPFARWWGNPSPHARVRDLFVIEAFDMPQEAYEVEFDQDGGKLILITVKPEDFGVA